MADPEWFSSFQRFTYDSQSGVRSNFVRLAAQYGWDKETRKRQWIDCQTACFASLYGGDADTNKLEKWQQLCLEVGVEETPSSITGCKRELSKVHVNLVNHIDHRLTGAEVKRFESFQAFRNYTSKGRTYPRGKAKEKGFIKALLRKL